MAGTNMGMYRVEVIAQLFGVTVQPPTAFLNKFPGCGVDVRVTALENLAHEKVNPADKALFVPLA